MGAYRGTWVLSSGGEDRAREAGWEGEAGGPQEGQQRVEGHEERGARGSDPCIWYAERLSKRKLWGP